MTGDVYACTFRGTLAEAVGRLPNLSPLPRQHARATGTDSHLAPHLARKCAGHRSGMHGVAMKQGSAVAHKPLKNKDFTSQRGARQSVALHSAEMDTNHPQGESNPCLQDENLIS